MMSVNRYKIRVNDVSGSTASTINIPISMNFIPVDQADIIEREFINKETENAINPIEDFEQVRFLPIIKNQKGDFNQIENVQYNVHLKENNPGLALSSYDEIGFVSDDVKFRRNNLKNSFLRLSFYDSENPTEQNLLFFITVFTNIDNTFFNIDGNPRPLSTIKIQHLLSDPIQFPQNFAEGYYLYYDKAKLVGSPRRKEIYMRASYNNAKTGKSINLSTTPNQVSVSDLINTVYTKYTLENEGDIYRYIIDDSKGNVITDIIDGNDKLTIKLYEIQVL